MSNILSGNSSGDERTPTVILLESESSSDDEPPVESLVVRRKLRASLSSSSEMEAGRSKSKDKKRKPKPDTPTTFSTPKILFRGTFRDIDLTEFDNIDCDTAPIISGFPSEGLVSLMSANFFIDELKLPLIGVITSPSFPPTCRIRQGQPSHATRIYGDKRLVVFTSEFKQLEDSTDAVHGLVEAMYDFARRHRCRQIFSVEGLAENLGIEEEEPDIETILRKVDEARKETKDGKIRPLRFMTDDATVATTLMSKQATPIREAIVGGITGALLAYASTHPELSVTCLLAPYNPLLSDARSSIQIVLTVCELLRSPVELDSSPLEKKADKLEKQIYKALNKLSGQAVPKQLKDNSMYL